MRSLEGSSGSKHEIEEQIDSTTASALPLNQALLPDAVHNSHTKRGTDPMMVNESGESVYLESCVHLVITCS